jgi:hypothetical protein
LIVDRGRGRAVIVASAKAGTWEKRAVDDLAAYVAQMSGAKLPIVHDAAAVNECWLYVNGYLVGHREQDPVWWNNDYKFEWDLDLTGHLFPGTNTLTLRVHNPHHFGGMFRRPFVYQPTN